MSALTSPPNVRDNKRPNVEAFSKSPLDDPFLPAASNPEDLLQATVIGFRPATAGPQPSYHGSHPPSAHNSHVNSQRNSHSPTGSYSQHQPMNDPDSYQFNTTQNTNHNLSASPSVGQDFLSSYDYSSEFIPSEFSEQATPSFEDEFLMAAGYSSLPELENGQSNIYSDPTQGNLFAQPRPFDQQPVTSNSLKHSSPGTFATSQPQLLSPVLTNTPSPSSEYRNLHVGAAPMSGNPKTSHAPDMATRRTRADIPPRALQHTPTLTGSSNSSLGPGPAESIARAASPIVRVSSYSRGDSPARSQDLARSSSKRSRTSQSPGHLSPARDEDLSEDEPEQQRPTQPLKPSLALSAASRTDDGSWVPNALSGHAGIDPTTRSQMNEVYVPSIKQLDDERQLKERMEHVENWMDKSDAGSDAGEDPNAPDPQRKAEGSKLRRRARSMVEPIQTSNIGLGIDEPVFDDSGIPGPGALIDEESGDDDESETLELESPPADVDTAAHEEAVGYFPAMGDEEPLPRQFYRAKPWHDALPETGITDTKIQPATSNAAIMRFKQRAENIETASRSATWGTRRMSETDINKVIGPDGLFKSLSLNRASDKEKTQRRPSILNRAEQAAARLLPKRSNSNMKRKLTENSKQNASTDSVGKPKKESLGTLVPPKRSSSFGRTAKGPQLNTGSAVAAMATSIAAVGGSGQVSATSSIAPTGWAHTKGVIRRNRSRSELPRSKPSASPGLAELMTVHGGPPMPTLASPHQEKPVPRSLPRKQEGEEDDEDDEDEAMEERGVAMDLKVRTDTITPTFDGFKNHVRQLNPRLQPFLVDRIGTEQLRRYKKLVEFKVKHVHTISTGRCPSGDHCFAQGGEATMLPPRTSAKDPETTYAGFQVTGTGSEDESSAFAEGTVTAALFPPGVPLPPVKRLPAEFECSLCFKVKKFQKPSDWTKHVHEDVQPFTCTFPSCAEPKSFKRKADWVRHENERHRQLEWWTCNMPDCNHKCFRKDNFVQHLVREHKKPEPKIKAVKPTRAPGGKDKPRGGSKTQAEVIEEWKANLPDPAQEEVDAVWRLVDECWHDTKKMPKDEACKFCGNVCNSWKKLTVHLAKHMEQVAMPVLELVRQREVDPDTIISPMEKLPVARMTSGSPDTPQTKMEPTSVSPYSVASSHIPQQHAPDISMGAYGQGMSGYYPTSQPLTDYATAFQPQVNHLPQMQGTSMSGYGHNAQAAYDIMTYPSYSISPQPQQQGVHGRGTFMPINATVNSTPATYPPAFLPSRSSQRIPGPAGQTFVPEQMQQAGGQGQEVYGSPIDGMTYVYPTTSMPGMQNPIGYDVPYPQAGDNNQGPYQGLGGGHGGYGYQQ